MVLRIVMVGAILLMSGFCVYINQHGVPLSPARLLEVHALLVLILKYFVMFLIAVFALLVVLLWWNRDPAVKAAAKLSLAGRHAEAEAMIRRQIEAKGPNEQRRTMLGLLLMEQNRLEESLQQMQEALRFARRPANAKSNCATVLWKLGRREEAAKLFEEVCGQNPSNFFAVCNYCLTLAEMGHEAQARERLQQAEQIFARYDLRYTKTWVPLLEQCRKAIPPAQGFPVILPQP